MYIHSIQKHDDVIKWKYFPRYWPFLRGIHRSPVKSPHIGQWRGDLMFSLICKWINGLVNNREAGDLRRHRAHYDVTLMIADQTLNLQNTRHTSLLGLWGVYCKYYRTHWPYYNMSTMHIPQTTLGSRPAYSRVVVAQRDCCSFATSSSDCCTIYETPTPTHPPSYTQILQWLASI